MASMRLLLIVLAAAGALLAQQITLSSSPGLAPAGATVTLTVSLVTGGSPAGVQWNMTGVPIGAVIASTVTGKAATCNGSATVAPTICVLSGLNVAAIADGPIATIQYMQPAMAPIEALAVPLSATPAGAPGASLTPGIASNCDLNKDGKVDATDVGLAVSGTIGPPATPPITIVDVIRVLVAALGGACLR